MTMKVSTNCILGCAITPLLIPLVTIFVPAQVMVSEGVARGTAQVCAKISGGSPYTTTTSAINATLVASEESPGEHGIL